MRKIALIVGILISTCIVSTKVSAQQIGNWALGLRVGEPTGLNIRKYGNRNALDINVGTYGGLFRARPYRQGLLRGVGFSASANYLWYFPVAQERVSMYGGLGGQITSRRYYPHKFEDLNGYVRNVGIGPTAVVGAEYFSRRQPSSWFIEGGMYAEVLPAILFFSPQLNAGVRYNF